jgi:hypothetical protein
MGLFDTLSVQNERVTILNPMCYPNTWVTGFFSFTITGEVTMRAIRLVMTGSEVTVIVTRNKKHSTRHTSTNKLVEQYYVVSGSSKSSPSSGDLALKPGDYSIPFQFLVPPGAPVSGTEGGPSMSLGVSYSVTGYIDIPWGSDATASAPFQVGVCMPVGQVQQLMMPVGFGEPRRVPITCCCCSKGEVSFTATVNQGVIVLDRPVTLDVTLKIDNSRGEEPETRCLLRNSSLSFFVLESLANRRFFIVPGEQDVQFRFQFLVLPQAVQVQKKGGVIFWI